MITKNSIGQSICTARLTYQSVISSRLSWFGFWFGLKFKCGNDTIKLSTSPPIYFGLSHLSLQRRTRVLLTVVWVHVLTCAWSTIIRRSPVPVLTSWDWVKTTTPATVRTRAGAMAQWTCYLQIHSTSRQFRHIFFNGLLVESWMNENQQCCYCYLKLKLLKKLFLFFKVKLFYKIKYNY